MSDKLDEPGRLTSHDYAFLTGTWDGPYGAAYNVVYEWCKNRGYGGYNDPTPRGMAAIKQFQAEHRM